MTAPRDILGRFPITKKPDPMALPKIDQNDDWKGEEHIRETGPTYVKNGQHMSSIQRYG